MAVFQVQYAVHRKTIRGILTAGVGKVRTSNKALQRAAIPLRSIAAGELGPLDRMPFSHQLKFPLLNGSPVKARIDGWRQKLLKRKIFAFRPSWTELYALA